MAPSRQKSESIQDEVQEASNVRTGVSLVLIFHLFALAIGVASTARPLSPLRNQLAEVPFIRNYLQLLHMDVAYNFHLTDGTEADIDHFLVVEPQGPAPPDDGLDDADPLRLPERDLQPGLRRERFQQLALVTATEQSLDPTLATLLPKAIAAGLLRYGGAPTGTYRMRIRRQTIVAREDADSPQPTLRDPYADNRYETAFEGAILFGEEQVDFLEIAPESQRAGLRQNEEISASGSQ